MAATEIQPGVRFAYPELILYPTFGYYHRRDGGWRLHVAGQASEPGPDNLRRRVLLRILQRLLRVSSADLLDPVFERRVAGFLVQSRKGCRIELQLGDRSRMLRHRSRRNGHFRDLLRMGDGELESLRETGCVQGGRLDFVARKVELGDYQPGVIHLVDQHGWSVVSDIDDTIKHSEVLERRTLLRNTFLEPFSAVAGMSDVYQRWAAAGASFHYVSSSPWQLYPCLQELLWAERFPEGSFHLRPLRLRDSSLVRWFLARRRVKGRIIRGLLRTLPERQFLLVGDSSEKDPEIYGALARRFPHQVQRILIRAVPGSELGAERLARAFRGLHPRRWQLFESPAEIGV